MGQIGTPSPSHRLLLRLKLPKLSSCIYCPNTKKQLVLGSEMTEAAGAAAAAAAAAPHKELEDLRSEMEALKEERRAKAELCDGLRRAHEEQLLKLQQAKAEIDRQAEGMAAKAAEASRYERLYGEARSSLAEKESALKQLSLANESLKKSAREEAAGLEGKNKELAAALDEASAKREEQAGILAACREEIRRVRGLLEASEKKCLDAELRAQAPMEVRRRDEMLMKLEEEKGEVENRMKWKVEQFRHLEDAHSKLQDEFRGAKREWGLERSNLVQEIHTLQTNLDSQTRLSEDLRAQLGMCNQALAHEESRRKLLQVQMSESKLLLDKVVSEYEDARSTIETLTTKRDEEIASLRSSFSTKSALLKESEFRRTQLEQDLQELQMSLKEYQESQINGTDAAASLKSLRQKFKALEQTHKSCSDKLKASESEWGIWIEKLRNELDDCAFRLRLKDEQLMALQVQLDGSESLLEQQKLDIEESSVMLMILKSKFLESCSNLEGFRLEIGTDTANMAEKITSLMKQLEKKNDALVRAQIDYQREREIGSSMQSRIEYLESVEMKYDMMQKELETYKTKIEESFSKLDHFKKQAFQKEKSLQDDLGKASDALEQLNHALSEKTSQLRALEFELQQQNLALERLGKHKCDLEVELKSYSDEARVLRNDIELAYLAKVEAERQSAEVKENSHKIIEEKEEIIGKLKQHISLMEEGNARQKLEVDMLVKSEVDKFTAKESKKIIEALGDINIRLEKSQEAVCALEQQSRLKERELLMNFDKAKAELLDIIKDKQNNIVNLQNHIVTLEENFSQSMEGLVASRHAESKQISLVYGAFQDIVAAHVLVEQELQFKNMMITEMEKEMAYLQENLKCSEEASLDSNNLVEQLKANLLMQSLEAEKKQIQVLNELKCLKSDKTNLENEITELKANRNALHDEIKRSSSERENLVGQTMELHDMIRMMLQSDEQLMSHWERVLHKASDEDATIDSERKYLSTTNSVDGKNSVPITKNKAEQRIARSPLKDHNC